MSISTPSRRTRFATVAPWISTLGRLVLAGVFIAAGLLKVVDPQSSVQAVRGYDLLPLAWTTVIGHVLPFVEIALGLLLVAGLFTRAVATVAAVLLSVFVAAVVSAAARGLTIDCGCFGGGGTVARGETAYGAEIARDVLFLLLALWLVWRPRSRLSLDHADVAHVEAQEAAAEDADPDLEGNPDSLPAYDMKDRS